MACCQKYWVCASDDVSGTGIPKRFLDKSMLLHKNVSFFHSSLLIQPSSSFVYHFLVWYRFVSGCQLKTFFMSFDSIEIRTVQRK